VATVNDDEVKLVKVQGNSSGTSIRTPTSCSWSSTASCAPSPSTTATSSSGQVNCWWCHVGRHGPAADQETRVVFLELRDTVNTGDADRAGTVGERLT